MVDISIPKKIWFLWLQGFSETPFVVQQCYKSWKEYNPDWEVIFLDENSWKNYTTISLSDEKLSKISKNHLSNLIRLQLLAKHGGVWVDATCLCRQPLNKWLCNHLEAGFFAFSYRTRSYGWIFTWFLAAEPDNLIVTKTAEKLTSFYEDNEFYDKEETIFKKRVEFLEKFLNRKYKTTRFWSSWLVRKVFKVYPYFTFHYIFAKLINSDKELLKLYKQMKPNTEFYDKGKSGLLRTLDMDMKNKIDNGNYVIYKLTWKYREEENSPTSILSYLLGKKI